jgi:predicted TIM-barrel fold metal-dependent hydrolase
MKGSLRIIDADGHTMEPPDLYERYIDPAFRHRLEGHTPMRLAPGVLEALRFQEQLDNKYSEFSQAGFEAAALVKGLDVEGIDVSVIYGPLYMMWLDGIDPGFSAALCRAYNRWLHDYSADSGGRIVGAAPLPIQDVRLAVAEFEYAYDELGIGAFWVRPNPVAGRVLGDRAYDPLYAALQERNAPLSLHEGMGAIVQTAGADRFTSFTELHACCHPMEQQMAMLSLMVDGVFDRFPRLRVAFMESGCSWAPAWLHRMDEHVELTGWYDAPELQLMPSEYFRRNCYISCDPDEDLLWTVVETLGDEQLLFATDFPHPDAKYPHAVDAFMGLQRVSADTKAKILWDNAKRFYGAAVAS